MVFGSLFGDFTQHHRSEKKEINNGKKFILGKKKIAIFQNYGHIFYIMEIIVLKT